MWRTLAFIPSILLTATIARAELIARCGASAGYSVFLESALMPKAQAGWAKDGIAKGALQLVRDGTQFDVVYTDIASTRSARSDGFEIFRMPSTPANRYLLIGINPSSGVMEHWLFNLDGQGRGKVIWGTVRGGTAFPKSSLMEAACGAP